MKLRNAVKFAVVGSLAAAPGLVSAANSPLTGAHGSWSITAGGGVTGDPAGMTCGTLTSGTGFVQQECTDGTRTYFRTVVAEGTTGQTAGTAGFSDESFVVENGAGGLSGVQSINAGSFNADSTFNTGGEFMPMNMLGSNPTLTAVQNAQDMITLSQSYSNSAQEFTTTFDFAHGMAMDGTNGMAKYALLELGQNTNDTGAGFTSSFDLTENEYEGASGTLTNAEHSREMGILQDLTGGIDQSFELAEAEGQAVTAGGSASVVGKTGTVSFSAGDAVMGMQINQDTGTSEGLFSFGKFENETTSTGLHGHTLSSTGQTVTVSPDPFGSPYNFN